MKAFCKLSKLAALAAALVLSCNIIACSNGDDDDDDGSQPQEKTYTITFNANGGTFSDNATTVKKSVTANKEMQLASLGIQTPTLSGSVFIGWGAKNATVALTSITVSANTTLYALWAKADASGKAANITVMFYADDADGKPSVIGTQEATAGRTTPLKTAEALGLSKEGKTFKGWATVANAGKAAYSDSESVTFAADTSLYAVWSASASTETVIGKIAAANGAVSVQTETLTESDLNAIIAAMRDNPNALVTLDLSASGIEGIAASQFRQCTGLVSITLPETLASIGSYAFLDCTNLERVNIPAEVKSIGNGAFGYCPKLTSITVADGNKGGYTAKDGKVFWTAKSYDSTSDNDSMLTALIAWPAASGEITLPTSTGDVATPDAVTVVTGRAFYHNTAITAVTVPEGFTGLGAYTFASCSKLQKVALPATLTGCTRAFSNCIRLTDITVASGNSAGFSASDGKIYGTSTDSDGNKTVTLIAWPSASGAVTIPSDVTRLAGTFTGATKLTSITVPDTVTSIGSYTFENCTKLESATFADGVPLNGNGIFSSCTSLKTLTLPASTTNIPRMSFYSCTNLAKIRVEADIPPSLATPLYGYDEQRGYYGIFEGCTALATIEVPEGSLELYKTAWAELTGISFVGYKSDSLVGKILSATGDYTIKVTETTESDLDNIVRATTYNTEATFTLDLSSISGVTALSGMSSLNATSVIIGGSITEIESRCFYGSAVEDFTFTSTTPPTLGTRSLGSNVKTIVVPNDAESTYRNAEGWKSYARYIPVKPVSAVQVAPSSAAIAAAKAGEYITAISLLDDTGSAAAFPKEIAAGVEIASGVTTVEAVTTSTNTVAIKLPNAATSTLTLNGSITGVGFTVAVSADKIVSVLYAQNYETATEADWKEGVTNAYTPVLATIDDNTILTVNGYESSGNERQTNNRWIYSGSICEKLPSGDFVLSFDIKIANGNNQKGAGFYIFDSSVSKTDVSSQSLSNSASPFFYDFPAENAEKIVFSLVASEVASENWLVNGSTDTTTLSTTYAYSSVSRNQLSSLSWFTVTIERIGNETYVTIAKKDSLETPFARQKVTASATDGIGAMMFTTGRYFANFALDNIVVYTTAQ